MASLATRVLQRGKMATDEGIDLPISEVCHCGGHVALSSQPYIHQKVDLPEIKPYVVTYHVHHGRCKKCGKQLQCCVSYQVL